MNEKSEALRLADRLENGGAIDAYACRSSTAAELRRLSAVEAQRDALLESLKEALEALKCVDLQSLVPDYGSGHYSVARLDGPQVKSAIAALRAVLAQPVQEPAPMPPFPPVSLWKRGCAVCGIGAGGHAYGYACPRSDCPTRVTCGGTV